MLGFFLYILYDEVSCPGSFSGAIQKTVTHQIRIKVQSSKWDQHKPTVAILDNDRYQISYATITAIAVSLTNLVELDYAEEQQNELEALQSIYPDEFEGTEIRGPFVPKNIINNFMTFHKILDQTDSAL